MIAGALTAPGQAWANGIIAALSVNPSVLNNGASAQGTVTLIPIDSNPTTVNLLSSDPSAATVPPSVVAPAGASTVTFTISSNAAAPSTSVTIMAWIGSATRTASLLINPDNPPGPSLAAVSIDPDTLTGGSSATGTVSFTGATDGAVVNLASSNPDVVAVQPTAMVPAGGATGAFAVSTSAVEQITTATITATWFGTTRTATVTVVPGDPAPADEVEITKARWKGGILEIRATSTNPAAILSVYSRSDSFMFTLTNDGGGNYSARRQWLFDPEVITVRSNFGGEDTARTRH